jgi:DNA-binding ferritin-like protein
MENESAEFIAALLHSGTVAHFMHLSTDSFAVHDALNTYYHEIIDKVDEYAEAFMGRYDQIKTWPEEFHSGKDPVDYFNSLKDFVEQARKELPQDTELQNLVDEIADLINSTLYKLRFLTKG